MEDERCTLFTFMSGSTFAAVLHILCGLSAWCCPVFPILPIILFLLERNSLARVTCVHTAVACVAVEVLAFIPVVLWLIIRGATHAAGAFYVLCTVLFVAVLLILAFVLLAVELTCGIKALKKEPVEVPFITAWTSKLAAKLMGSSI